MSDFQLQPRNRGISNENALSDLRRVADLLEKSMITRKDYRNYGRCSTGLFEVRFGTWNKALLAAGLVISHRQDITEEELFENIERVWTTLGRQPRRREMVKPLSSFSKGTYETRFGGWHAALGKFVSYANGDSTPLSVVKMPISTETSSRDPNLRLRWRVFTRDSFRCRSCGRTPAIEQGVVLHVDHIIPWSKGGLTVYENLQLLCDRCNIGKSDLIA